MVTVLGFALFPLGPLRGNHLVLWAHFVIYLRCLPLTLPSSLWPTRLSPGLWKVTCYPKSGSLCRPDGLGAFAK